MKYYVTFDASTISGNLTVTATGETTKTIAISAFADADINGTTTQLYSHYPLAISNITGPGPNNPQLLNDHSATAFGQHLVDALNTTPTWSNHTFKVDFDISAGAYTISNIATGTAVFAMSMSGEIARFLGYSGSKSGAATYTSDYVVSYAIDPTLSAVSEVTPLYESDGVAAVHATDSGLVHGHARSQAPMRVDFLQQFESKAKTVQLVSVVASHPWTFQHLIEHCRDYSLPFVVYDGFGDGNDHVLALRAEGTSLVPERASPGDDTQFHIPFRCYYVGITTTETDGSFT